MMGWSRGPRGLTFPTAGTRAGLDDEHPTHADGRHRDEDVSRERYRELLEELRTIIPGAQVLLGFLLTVPFAGRFTEVDDLGEAVFLVALVAVAGRKGHSRHRVERACRRDACHAGNGVQRSGRVPGLDDETITRE